MPLPAGLIQTAAQAFGARVRSLGAPRRRKRRAKKRASGTRKTKRARGKPKPGTKAWMAYIRSKRKK